MAVKFHEFLTKVQIKTRVKFTLQQKQENAVFSVVSRPTLRTTHTLGTAGKAAGREYDQS